MGPFSGLVIWKYEFPVSDRVTLKLPAGAEILSVGVQTPRNICLWVKVAPHARKQSRTFLVVGTGGPLLLEAKKFVGTAFDGEFVWHVFEGETEE